MREMSSYTEEAENEKISYQIVLIYQREIKMRSHQLQRQKQCLKKREREREREKNRKSIYIYTLNVIVETACCVKKENKLKK